MKHCYSFIFALWAFLMLPTSQILAHETLINRNGNKSAQYSPIARNKINSKNYQSQTQYLAEQLADMNAGDTIHALTFYPIDKKCDTIEAFYAVRLFETNTINTSSGIAGIGDTTNATLVYEGPLPYCNGEMRIEFTTPYIYQGRNLVVDFNVQVPSSNGMPDDWFYGSEWDYYVHAKENNLYTKDKNQAKMLMEYTFSVNQCRKPTNIRLDEISHTYATISWTPGDSESSWEITIDSVTTVISTPSYTLSSLSPATAYTKTLALRSICGVGDTSDVRNATLSFVTECNDATLPYVEDFENETPNVQPLCWIFSNNTSIAGNSSSKYLSLNGTSGGAYAITPRLSHPAKELTISFSEQEHAQYPRWTTYGQCVLGTITDPSDITTFTPLDTLPASKESYRHVEYFLKDAPSSDYYVMFYYNGYNTSSYLTNYCYIDSIQVDVLPTCFPVTDIRLDTVLATTAELSWSPGKDEQAWDVLVLSAGGDTLFNNTVTTNHCTIPDLTHRTPYTISAYVRANCGDGDLGRVTSATFSFETSIACGTPIVTLPFTENFESTSAETRQMPSCWTKIVRPTAWDRYPYVYSSYTYCHSCDHTLYIEGYNYGIYTVLPEFSMDVNKLQINLWTRNSLVDPTHGSFIVGAMSNPNDSTTFFPIDTLPQSENFTEHLVYLDRVPAGYKYIAILYDRFGSGTSWLQPTGMIDDVTVDYAPVCLAIEDIRQDAVSANSAVFSWKPKRANPYGYEVTVRNEYDNSVLLFDTVFSPSLLLTDLDFSSDYRLAVSVATICQPGNIAEPYEKTFFVQTECHAIDSLYRESFEHYAAYPYKAPSISTPDCWDVINANSRYSSQRIYVTNNASFVHEGKQSLLFEYSYDKSAYAIMPEMNMDLSEYQISFFYHLIGSYHPGTLTLGYIPKDSLADTAFVAITTLQYTSSWNSLENYRLENVPKDVRLAFKYHTPNMPNGCNLTDSGIAIDDILIEEINNDETIIPSVGIEERSKVTKFIRDGNIFIFRDGKIYNIFGIVIDENNNGFLK